MRTLVFYVDKALGGLTGLLAWAFMLGVLPITGWIILTSRFSWLLYVLATYLVIGGLIWFSEWLSVQVCNADDNPYSYHGTDFWFFWFWMLVGWYEYLRSR